MGRLEYATLSLPKSRRRRTWVIVAACLCALSWGGYRLSVRAFGPATEDVSKMVFANAAFADLDVTLRHNGEMAAVSSQEVVCEVENQSTIEQIVPEGTFLHKGDVIATLDSADIKKNLQTAIVEEHKCESDVTFAKEQQSIQESTNQSTSDAALVELELAKLDLREYTQGKYPADLLSAQRDVEMAQITLNDKSNALSDTRKLLEKGFVTAEDEKKAQVEQLTAQNDLEKKQTALKVLEQFTHEKDETDKQSKVSQAEAKVAHVKRENASNLAEKIADAEAKENAQMVAKQTMDHLQDQLIKCTIKAPGDGIVLYGGGQRMYYVQDEQPIRAGGKVFQQQTIARLPDTSSMKVTVSINESEVGSLRVDPKNKMPAKITVTGLDHPLWGWVSEIPPVPDGARRWWDPDAKEYLVSIALDQTPAGLKPGASAEVEIYVNHIPHALTVPLAALYRSGTDTYAFVPEDGRIVPRKVTVGESSRTAVRVIDGLTENQRVLLLGAGQGRELLDKAGIKPPATTEPSPTVAPPPGAVPTA